jgi:hypothetical protein
MALTAKLASRTFWLVAGIIMSANGALYVKLISDTIWSGTVLGALGIWITGKYVAGKKGEAL